MAIPIGKLLTSEIGGGWGQEAPTDSEHVPAAVIRGTDIPRVALGETTTVPRRFHRPSAVASRLLMANDIILEVSGGSKDQPIGRALLVSERILEALGEEVMCASFCKLMRVDESLAFPPYVFHVLEAAYRDGSLGAYSVQSTGITNLKWKAFLADFQVELPDRTVQERVAGVLAGIDDLVLNGRRRIDLLELMAQAIYREWFVHFRYPGHEDGNPASSSLGPLPSGWEMKRLIDVAVVNATRRDASQMDSFQYLDISSLGVRAVGSLARLAGLEAPGRARRGVAEGDVVWATVRPGRRAHALLLRVPDDLVGSTALAVITPQGVPSSYLFEALSTLSFTDYLTSKERGAAYPAVVARDFEAAPVLLPPKDLLEDFDRVVAPSHHLVAALREQASTLMALRDLLLPKLVSGEVDVSSLGIDELVGERAI